MGHCPPGKEEAAPAPEEVNKPSLANFGGTPRATRDEMARVMGSCDDLRGVKTNPSAFGDEPVPVRISCIVAYRSQPSRSTHADCHHVAPGALEGARAAPGVPQVSKTQVDGAFGR